MLLAGLAWSAQGAPPFSGTIFLDPDIITAADPTAFKSLADAGHGYRRMFDRRVNSWIDVDAFLFQASYNDGLSCEIQVNPEFATASAAQAEAAKYAPAIGRLPTCLRASVQTVWIHRGDQPFGGGNNNLLIHTGQADRYVADGILEETLIHEATHTSLDAFHARAPGWLAAQTADGEFISTYARDNPTREDVAESFLPYLAVRHRADRISATLSNTICQTIPSRIAYFDSAGFDLYPIVPPRPLAVREWAYNPATRVLTLAWNSSPGVSYTLEVSTNLVSWQDLVSGIASQGERTVVTHTNGAAAAGRFLRVRY